MAYNDAPFSRQPPRGAPYRLNIADELMMGQDARSARDDHYGRPSGALYPPGGLG